MSFKKVIYMEIKTDKDAIPISNVHPHGQITFIKADLTRKLDE